MGTPVTVEGWVSDPVDVHFSEPIPPTPNRDGVTFRTVTVATAGDTPQGPDVEIPDGFALVAQMRVGQTVPRTGFTANSAANVGDATLRTNVPVGGVRKFYISNMNILFFGADTDGTIFELFVEQ